MVGLPGVGKSTYINNYLPDTTVISTDDIIEFLAAKYSMTYNDVFGPITYNFAERVSHKLAQQLFARGDDIVWDQTNLTVASRCKKLDLVPAHYSKIAIVFQTPADHNDRLASRPHKHIPVAVMESMTKAYQQPTYAEGYDAIWWVPNVL